MSNHDLTKVEFLLTLEGNFIVQRFFNVKDFNSDALRSVEIYNTVKEICDEIAYDLKIKTIDYLQENRNNYYDFEDVESEKDLLKEHFLLELKVDNRIFISRIFPAQIYHPKIRYTVDIRPKIRSFLSELTDALSLDQPELDYMGYNLKKYRK